MCPSLLRRLRGSHADCACHEPSAAICLKLRASAIPSGRATGTTHLRGCWPASMRSMVPPTYSIACGARVVGTRKRPDCLQDGSMPTAKKTSCATSFSGLRPGTLILDWTSRALRVVAEFRAAVTGYSDDPDIRRLVDELRIGSSDFERCWETQGVLAREGGERAFNIRPWDYCTIGRCRSLSRLARLSTNDASLYINRTQPMTGIEVSPPLAERRVKRSLRAAPPKTQGARSASAGSRSEPTARAQRGPKKGRAPLGRARPSTRLGWGVGGILSRW